MPRTKLIGVALGIGLGTGLCALFFIALFLTPRYLGHRLDRMAASRVVADIEAGRLIADSRGVVRLPSHIASLSEDGEVYVAHRPGLLMVFFVTFRMRGDYRGYLYTSRVPSAAERYRGDSTIQVPVFGLPYVRLPLTRSVGLHWWYCEHIGTG